MNSCELLNDTGTTMKLSMYLLGVTMCWIAATGLAQDSVETGLQAIRSERIRAAMRFLSDDALEGRGTATRGHELAAKYVASEFEALGLEPAGDNGTYFQAVPLRAMVADQTRSQLVVVHDGGQEQLIARKDF